MKNIISKSKELIEFAVLSTFILCILYSIQFLYYTVNLYTNNSPVVLFWILVAFISGLLSVGSRSIYPFIMSFVTEDGKHKLDKNIRRLIFLSIGIVIALSVVGFSFGYIGNLIEENFHNLSTISSYLYVLSGVSVYLISISALNFIKIERRSKYPNIFNKNNNLFNMFMTGFLSSLIDLIPLTLLLIGESISGGDANYGMVIFLFHALGRILPLFIIETIARFGVNIKNIVINAKNSLNTYLNAYLLSISSLLLYIGALFYVQNNEYFVNSNIKAFVYDGWLIAILLLTPLWYKFFKEERRVFRTPAEEFGLISLKIKNIENECEDLRYVSKFNEKSILDKVDSLKNKLHYLAYESKIIESSIRHNAKYPIRIKEDQIKEERELKFRLIATVIVTMFVITLITLFVN